MSEAIVVAVLSLVGTLGGSLTGILAANKLTNYRIQQLEKRVEAHNQVIERVYLLEKHEAVMGEEIRVANHRIDDTFRARKYLRFKRRSACREPCVLCLGRTGVFDPDGCIDHGGLCFRPADRSLP